MDSPGIFDIIGPVMIGPSSSHTAGAQRIGFEFSKKMRGTIRRIEITLFNSFAATGDGHGTKTALVAGILGISAEDGSLKKSLEIAKNRNISVSFREEFDETRHPNSAQIFVETDGGNFCCFGESLGGGMISFRETECLVVRNA